MKAAKDNPRKKERSRKQGLLSQLYIFTTFSEVGRSSPLIFEVTLISEVENNLMHALTHAERCAVDGHLGLLRRLIRIVHSGVVRNQSLSRLVNEREQASEYIHMRGTV